MSLFLSILVNSWTLFVGHAATIPCSPHSQWRSTSRNQGTIVSDRNIGVENGCVIQIMHLAHGKSSVLYFKVLYIKHVELFVCIREVNKGKIARYVGDTEHMLIYQNMKSHVWYRHRKNRPWTLGWFSRRIWVIKTRHPLQVLFLK